MTHLASWLLEQIAADEQVAREATEGRWHWVMGGLGKNDRNMLVADAYVPGDGWHTVLRAAEMPLSAVDAEHIARWDPARVLAECAAKRNVVAEYEKALAQRRELAGGPHSTEAAARLLTLLGVLRVLALPYADRAGYEEATKPVTRTREPQ